MDVDLGDIFSTAPQPGKRRGRPRASDSARSRRDHAMTAIAILRDRLEVSRVASKLGLDRSTVYDHARRALQYDDFPGIGELRRLAAERGLFGERLAEPTFQAESN